MFRTWTNALALATFVVAIVGIVLASSQWTLSHWQWWATLGVALCIALLVAWLSRPTGKDATAARLRSLLGKSSERDLAMLRTATTFTHYPKEVSDHALALAPPNVSWQPESKPDAQKRAHRLIALGLLEWRSEEVVTTALGRRVIALDDVLRGSP